MPSNDLDLASGVLKAHSAKEVPGIFSREPLHRRRNDSCVHNPKKTLLLLLFIVLQKGCGANSLHTEATKVARIKI